MTTDRSSFVFLRKNLVAVIKRVWLCYKIFVFYTKIMSHIGNSTDAMPSPPRGQAEEPKENLEKEKFVEDEKPKKKQPYPNSKFPAGSINVLNIHGSSHVTVGNHFTNYYNATEASPRKAHFEKHETKQTAALKENQTEVSQKDLMLLSQHIDKNWVWIARHFGYSSGQIEQFEYQYRNLREIIYQFLLDWVRNSDNPATVSELAKALWDSDQQEAVLIWSRKYDDINM